MTRTLSALVLGFLLVPGGSSAEAASAKERSDALLALLRDEFTELTGAEVYLVKMVCAGQPADYRQAYSDERAASDQWRSQLRIRTDRVVWMCSHREAVIQIPHQGVVVRGARFDGPLNLSFAEAPFPISLEDCQFPAGVKLENASLKELSLAGSIVSEIDGEGLRIERDLDLSYGFRADGEVRLTGANVGGHFEASGGEFRNPGPDALFLDGSVILGDLNLRYGFLAEGRVSLKHAKVHGNIDTEGGHIVNPGQVAFAAEGITVDGDLLMRDDFRAEGETNLAGARINGQALLTGGQFENPGATAINAEAIEVHADLRMRVGFRSTGEIDLTNARIGGNFSTDGAELLNPDGVALAAKRIRVEGDTFFGNRAVPESKSDVDSPADPDYGFHADGTISLESANLLGTFSWVGVRQVRGTRLDLRFAQIGRLWFEPEGWPLPGDLILQGASYQTLYNHRHVGIGHLIDWVRRQPAEPLQAQPYEQLAGALRKNGQEEDADAILIAREEDRMAELSPSRQWLHRLLGVTIGYGYDPWRAIWIGLGIVAWGSIVFGIGARAGLIAATKEVEHVFEEPEGHHHLSNDYPRFNALVYSLDMFVPLLDLHQANYWLPSAQRGRNLGMGALSIRSGGTLRLYLGIHIYLGWALTTLLAVGLSGLVQS